MDPDLQPDKSVPDESDTRREGEELASDIRRAQAAERRWLDGERAKWKVSKPVRTAPRQRERRDNGRPRRAASKATAGRGGDSGDDPPPPPSSLTFPNWHRVTPDLPGWARARWFDCLPDADQNACWDDLAECCRLWNESEYLHEQRRWKAAP